MKITAKEVEQLVEAYYKEDINSRANLFFYIDGVVKNVPKEDRPNNFFKLTNILVMG